MNTLCPCGAPISADSMDPTLCNNCQEVAISEEEESHKEAAATMPENAPELTEEEEAAIDAAEIAKEQINKNRKAASDTFMEQLGLVAHEIAQELLLVINTRASKGPLGIFDLLKGCSIFYAELMVNTMKPFLNNNNLSLEDKEFRDVIDNSYRAALLLNTKVVLLESIIKRSTPSDQPTT